MPEYLPVFCAYSFGKRGGAEFSAPCHCFLLYITLFRFVSMHIHRKKKPFYAPYAYDYATGFSVCLQRDILFA